jgi:hypothetical protein
MRQAIATKFIGPTNHRGARVKAWCEAGSKTVHWDHSIGIEGNHAAAARALAADLDWTGDWIGGALPGSGYCFVLAEGADFTLPAADDGLLGGGHEVRHDMHGFYVCTAEEAEHEDAGNASVGFDGRPHFASIDAARKAFTRDPAAVLRT